MPESLQDLLGYVNEVSLFIQGVLAPFIGLILAACALLLVVHCLREVYDLVVGMHRRGAVLRVVDVAADSLIAGVLLMIVTMGTNPGSLLYLVASAAIAIAVRLGVAKLERR